MTRAISRRPSSESRDSTGPERIRGDPGAGIAVTQRANVGQKRKRKGRALPSPPPAPPPSGARTHQAGKRALRTGKAPSVAVPVKEEAAAAAVVVAAAAAAAAGAAGTAGAAAPSVVTFSPVVFRARETAAALEESSSSDPGDRVKAEVAVS